MLKSTETLIKQVFEDATKYQPDLSVYTVPRGDGLVNFRQLGNQLIENFPWPIGVELRRLFSVNQLDAHMLNQLFRTFERSVQFLSFIMICQVIETKIKDSIEIPDNFRSSFRRRYMSPSQGDYVWLIRSLGHLMKKQDPGWFLPEISTILSERFYEDCDACVKQRNEHVHFQSGTSEFTTEKKCVIFSETLTRILSKLAFLIKYKLVYVKEIKVIKFKNQEAHFHHDLDLLHSTHSDFSMEELDEKKYTESHSVLLMKSTRSIDEYLNLSPLVIDTSAEIIDEERRFNIRKDIYMYSKFTKDHLVYAGTETTELCDLRSLHNYEMLIGEFREILSILS